MGLILVGANHRSAALEIREELAFTDDKCISTLERWKLAGAVDEALILSTCNRVDQLPVDIIEI